MKPQTVEEALNSLAAALARDYAREQVAKIRSAMNGGGAAVHVEQAVVKRPYKRSAAGHARQVAAMKAYWKRKKAKKS